MLKIMNAILIHNVRRQRVIDMNQLEDRSFDHFRLEDVACMKCHDVPELPIVNSDARSAWEQLQYVSMCMRQIAFV